MIKFFDAYIYVSSVPCDLFEEMIELSGFGKVLLEGGYHEGENRL